MVDLSLAIRSLGNWAESLDSLIIGELKQEIITESGKEVEVSSLFKGLYGYNSDYPRENPRKESHITFSIGHRRVIGTMFPFLNKAYLIMDRGDKITPIREEEEDQISEVHQCIQKILTRRGYEVKYLEYDPYKIKKSINYLKLFSYEDLLNVAVASKK